MSFFINVIFAENSRINGLEKRIKQLENKVEELEKKISNFISTEIEWVPINKIKLKQEDKEKMFKFLEILEEDEDVQNVFTNAV